MAVRWHGFVTFAMATAMVLSGCTLLPPGGGDPPPGPTLPTLDASDRLRQVGNWNVIHRVDVPPGWTLSQVQVSGNAELSSWRKVGDEANSLCGVSVWGDFADFTPQPSGGEPVQVGGRAGLFLGKTDHFEALSGLWWHYRPDAWASLTCEADLGRDETVALAERVTFRPTKLLLPLRLTAVPQGYDVSYLGWDRVTGPPTYDLTLSHGKDLEFPLAPKVTMGTATGAGPSDKGAETMTINGREATYDSGARNLCFPLSGWRACVEGGPDSEPAEPDGDARLRERLLAVATELDFASDLDDPGTWFDGNRAAAA